MEDLIRNPEMQKMHRAALEAERTQETASEGEVMKRWQEAFPADPQVLFAKRLREFLEATADVDFAGRSRVIKGIAGETVGFVFSPAYEGKPWQWIDAFVVGKEATTAARAAAEAWLREIAPKEE